MQPLLSVHELRGCKMRKEDIVGQPAPITHFKIFAPFPDRNWFTTPPCQSTVLYLLRFPAEKAQMPTYAPNAESHHPIRQKKTKVSATAFTGAK